MVLGRLFGETRQAGCMRHCYYIMFGSLQLMLSERLGSIAEAHELVLRPCSQCLTVHLAEDLSRFVEEHCIRV